MGQTTTQQYVGNINGELLEEFREVQNEFEAIMRSPQKWSAREEVDHARRRTLVVGKILNHFEAQGGMRSIGSRVQSDNGAVFLTFMEE